MIAIPRQQDVAMVERGERQMKGVGGVAPGHDEAFDIDLGNFDDFGRDGEQWQGFQESELFGLLRVASVFQFLNHQIAGGGFKFADLGVPPLARPVAARNHLRLRSLVVVETWDRGFNVELQHTQKLSGQSIQSSQSWLAW